MTSITPNTSQLRLLASLKSQQWMIRPDLVQDVALASLEATEKASGEQRADSYWELFYTLRKPAAIDSNGIAHIEVRGALMDRAPKLYEQLGLATRYSTIVAESSEMKAAGAKGILYHVDSPGGTVAGAIEGGAAITDLGLPTVAYCNGLACSAAYWLASGASQIIAAPSATIGNIGAIISWADCDAFWEEMGITFKALVSEGADLKSTFHLEPDATQLEFLQKSIDQVGEDFRDHVAKGRAAAGATLDDEVWRAGWYSGERALALGLADGIGPVSDAIDALTQMIQNQP
jgi:ClpP class serine protease